jgi:hypothetical protein
MSQMVWPERPTCHGVQPRFASTEVHWRPPNVDPGSVELQRFADSKPFRTCSYCGCIHPADLIAGLAVGAKLGGSDWKYGWPHKFYVEGIPNPLAGQETVRSSKSWTDKETGESKVIYTTSVERAGTHAKWYNDHILDIEHEPTRIEFCRILAEHAHIKFEVVDGVRLKYMAPHRGYQA